MFKLNKVTSCVALCGAVWRCVALCGAVWRCVALCGVVWRCVALCGAVWRCVALCGAVWRCVALCGAVWRCVSVVRTQDWRSTGSGFDSWWHSHFGTLAIPFSPLCQCLLKETLTCPSVVDSYDSPRKGGCLEYKGRRLRKVL